MNSDLNDIFDNNFDLQADLVSNPSATYFMRVGSDAMMGDGILIGDKVVVDKAVKAQHKDIVIATVNGQFLIRQLYQKDGVTELRASNPSCATIPLVGDDQIWGVAVGIARKY